MLEPALGETARPRLNALSAFLAWLVLAFGFVFIGVAAQSTDIVWGLWITEVLAIALPALIFVRAAGVKPLDYLGFRLPKARWFAVAAVTALFNQPIVSLLTWVAQQLLPHGMVESFDAKNAQLDALFAMQPMAMLLAVSLSAPLGEEIFFRGFALRASARSMRPLYAAIFTAILFSAMHVDPVGALGLFEIGFWLAVLRWGSGSILPAMLGHALNNAVAGCWFLLGLQSTGRPPPHWAIVLGIDNPDAPPPAWVLLSGALLALLGLYFAREIFAKPSPQMEQDASGATEPRPGQRRAWPLWLVWAIALIAGALQLHHRWI